MSLSSSSSVEDAIAQYRDNLLWEGDLTKARAALEAIRFIQMTRPQVMATKVGFSREYANLDAQRTEIEAFLARADTTSQPRCSFVRGRALM